MTSGTRLESVLSFFSAIFLGFRKFFFFWSLIRFACVRSLCSQNLVGSLVYIPTNRPNLKLRHSVSICEQLMNLQMYVSRGEVQESKLPSRLSEGIYFYMYSYYLPTHPLDDLRSIESFSSCIVWCKLSSCSCVSHNLYSLMWLLSQFPSIWRATNSFMLLREKWYR